MKFSIVALPALFLGAWAAPAMMSKRDQSTEVTNIVSELLDNTRSSTGTINQTISGVSGNSVDKNTEDAVKLNIECLVKDVESAVQQITGLNIADGLIGEVLDTVSSLVAEILAEVSNTLNAVEDIISANDITNEVSDLTGSYSGLLSGLENLGLTNIVSTVTGLLSDTGLLSTVTGLLGGLPLGL